MKMLKEYGVIILVSLSIASSKKMRCKLYLFHLQVFYPTNADLNL